MANKHDPLEAAKSKAHGTAPAVTGKPLPPPPTPAGAPTEPLQAPQDGPAGTLPVGAPPQDAPQPPTAPVEPPSNEDPGVGPDLPPVAEVLAEEPARPLRVFRCLKDVRMAWNGQVLVFVAGREYTEHKYGPTWADHVEAQLTAEFALITPDQ